MNVDLLVDTQQGFTEQKRWGISFWDALIVTARRAGATTLWYSDLSIIQRDEKGTFPVKRRGDVKDVAHRLFRFLPLC